MYIYTHTLHCIALRCVALHCTALHCIAWHDMTYIATLTYTDTYLDLFENTSKKHQKTLKILAGVDPKGWPSGHVSGAVQVLKNWFVPCVCIGLVIRPSSGNNWTDQSFPFPNLVPQTWFAGQISLNLLNQFGTDLVVRKNLVRRAFPKRKAFSPAVAR